MIKQLGVVLILLVAFSGPAFAQASNEELQQKAAAAKEAAARNQQALRAYSWIAKTELSLKGEVKNTKIESCQYGPDGKVQKTELSEPPAPAEESSGRRGRRGRGRVKEKIVAKKTGEMKEELQAAAALVHSYVPPTGEKIQAVIAAGHVSMSQAGPGASAVKFADYEKSGDALTLTFDSETKALTHVAVDTWLDEATNKVTLDVTFQSLPDGTNYAAATVLGIPEKQIQVDIENSNYQKVTP